MNKIDGNILKNMIISAANNLQKNKELLNELNVFPVPDGDTGTNMALTILAVAKEVKKSTSNNISEVAKIASSGALRGARGNSGVILSQLFRGIYLGFEGKSEANIVDVANSLKEAANTAYKAVMKPKEGTILTVARETGDKAIETVANYTDIKVFLKDVYSYSEQVLSQTPEMLPALKEAGVVDSGGKGYTCIIEGFIEGLENDNVDIIVGDESSKSSTSVKINEISTADIEFGYCTEFIIENEVIDKAKVKQLNQWLPTVGDSIVVVDDESIVKVHVHTNNPGKVLQEAMEIGSLINIKIDNMRYQHENLVVNEKESKAKKELKELGFIAVAAGDGLAEMLTDLGVDYVITGGQTMNPSTEDILDAIDKVHAKEIIILPNNKNIILSSEQAQKIVEDKKVHIVKTLNLPQAVSAMVAYNPTLGVEENINNMNTSLSNVKTIEVTYAVRDTKVGKKEIKENDTLAILDGKIEESGKDRDETVEKILNKVLDEDSEFVTVYYGNEVKEEEAQKIAEYIEEKYEDCEVEVRYGGQPVYYFLISVE